VGLAMLGRSLKNMPYLVIETDLFNIDIPDEEIDQWVLGGDCADWFYKRLLISSEIKHQLEPTMEDWGWIMAVKTKGVMVDISIWKYLDKTNHWILGITGKKKFLRKLSSDLLRAAEQEVQKELNNMVEADDEFTNIEWLDQHPLETK
jgi:hypothetical protein